MENITNTINEQDEVAGTDPDTELKEQLNHYYHDQNKINQRLMELDDEWSTERIIGYKAASALCFTALFAVFGGRKWAFFSLCISIFLLLNSGKAPKELTQMLRKLGFRPHEEIEKEKYALKAIRGDFKYLLDVPNAVLDAVNK